LRAPLSSDSHARWTEERGPVTTIERLLGEDEVCVPLTQLLIDELVESPRYQVAGHERRRSGSAEGSGTDETGEDVDISGSTDDETTGMALFGKRVGDKSAPPPPSSEALEELAALEVAPRDSALGGARCAEGTVYWDEQGQPFVVEAESDAA
jgi:hypothetical protein